MEDPNAADRYGRTALHVAAIRGDKKIKMARKLLVGGAAVDAMDPRGATALHYAATNNARKMVVLFLTHRSPVPNVNAVDIDGQTALHLAVAQEPPLLDIVKLLVGLDDSVPTWCPKVDHTVRDHTGQTVVDYAVQRGAKALVKLLKQLPPPRRVPSTRSAVLPGPAPVSSVTALAATTLGLDAARRRSSLPVPEPTERGRAAEARHSKRVARAQVDRRHCSVGQPITARWGGSSTAVDPWLERRLRRHSISRSAKHAEVAVGRSEHVAAHAGRAARTKVQHPLPWATFSSPRADDHSAR